MNLRAPDNRRRNRLELIVTGTISLAVLLIAITYPRAGQSALIVIGEPGAAALADLPIVGRSQLGRRLIVRMPADRSAFDALTHGVLLIALPQRLC